jgi:glyoxylate utilization-related uncharacterized protein
MWDPSTNHDRREALFGGRGTVRVWNLSPTPMPPFTALLACELDPGGSVGAHVQQEFPETLIVIEGHGEAKVSEEPVALAPGVVVFLPLGKTLALENGSANVPLRYLIIKAQG